MKSDSKMFFGSLNTTTLRQELQNLLDANSLLDLVVFGRLAADTTVQRDVRSCIAACERQILVAL